MFPHTAAMADVDDLLAQFNELPTTAASKPSSHGGGTALTDARTASASSSASRVNNSQSTHQISSSTRHASQGSVSPGYPMHTHTSASRPSQDRPSASSSHVNPPHHHHSLSMPGQRQIHAGTTTMTPGQSQAPRSSLHVRDGLQDSLDDLLHDFDLPSPEAGPQPQSRQSCQRSTSNGQYQTNPKCMGPYLGGACVPRGRNGAEIGVLRCCDALRCTKCDFKVICFQQQGWQSDCDYLFFRNNYPTESKLRPKLARSEGTCAYCCQCSWRTVTGTEGVRVDSYASDLRWICGGHSA